MQKLSLWMAVETESGSVSEGVAPSEDIMGIADRIFAETGENVQLRICLLTEDGIYYQEVGGEETLVEEAVLLRGKR